MPQTFQELIAQSRTIIYDGDIGTVLERLGLPANQMPENAVFEQPAMVFAVAEAYVNAGSQIISTCSLGGNYLRLFECGLQDQVHELNQRAAQLAKDAAKGRALVAGSMGPFGSLQLTLNMVSYIDAVNYFATQARALADGGIDLFHIQTMSNLQEMRAAIEGVRRASDLPILATMSFDTKGKTLVGMTPAQAAQELTRWGVTAIGANCGQGPWEMTGILREMKNTVASAILIAKPNAGAADRRVYPAKYPVDAARFASHAREWVRAGAKIIGGCCGTTPEYITAIRTELYGKKPNDLSQTTIP